MGLIRLRATTAQIPIKLLFMPDHCLSLSPLAASCCFDNDHTAPCSRPLVLLSSERRYKFQCHYHLSVSIRLPFDHCLQCPLCMLLLPSMRPLSPSVIPVLALTACAPGYTTGHVPTHIPNTVHCRRCTVYLSQATEPETLIIS